MPVIVEIENQSKWRHKVPHEHVEKWQDKEIRIPVDGRIKMPKKEAIKFLGQYYPQTEDGLGDIVDSKALVIVSEEGQDNLEGVKYISNFNGEEYPTQEALNAHYSQVRRKLLKEEVKEEIKGELGVEPQSAGQAAFKCPHQNCKFETEHGRGLLAHLTKMHGADKDAGPEE